MAERTVGDVINELSIRQTRCLFYYLGIAHSCRVNALDLERSCAKERAGLDEGCKYRMKTVNSLTKEQLGLFHGLIEEACKECHENE